MLSAKGSGNNRFYVMALNDSSMSTSYKSAMSYGGNGWRIPEANEWAAFGSKYSLSHNYWSSTKCGSGYTNNDVWFASFSGNGIFVADTSYDKMYVRLCTTF